MELEEIFGDLQEGYKQIIFLYRNKKKSLRQVATEISKSYGSKISSVSIRNYLIKAGVNPRNKSQSMKNYWGKKNEKRNE